MSSLRVDGKMTQEEGCEQCAFSFAVCQQTRRLEGDVMESSLTMHYMHGKEKPSKLVKKQGGGEPLRP